MIGTYRELYFFGIVGVARMLEKHNYKKVAYAIIGKQTDRAASCIKCGYIYE